MHLTRSVITLVILLSFLHRSSSVASCCHLSATSTCHIFQLYQTACQEYPCHFSPTFILILTGVPCAGVVLFFLPAFFSLVTSNWTQDLQTLPYHYYYYYYMIYIAPISRIESEARPSISVLSSTHAIQPLCLITWVHISKKMQWYDKCKCEIHYGVSIIVYITLVVLMGCLFFALANPVKTTLIVWCISA